MRRCLDGVGSFVLRRSTDGKVEKEELALVVTTSLGSCHNDFIEHNRSHPRRSITGNNKDKNNKNRKSEITAATKTNHNPP